MTFEYYVPKNLNELIGFISNVDSNYLILAGGTDLINQIRKNELTPSIVVDISRVDSLRYINSDQCYIRIGALTSLSTIEKSSLINEKAKGLAIACREIGSPQIRNAGTIGGNIVNASPAADTVPPLIAHEARIKLKSIQGCRDMSVQDFLSGANKTVITANEVLTEVYFKIPNELTVSNFQKLGRRKALSIARLSIAVVMGKDKTGRYISDLKIALGAVGENPFRAYEAEKIMINHVCDSNKTEECLSKISEIVSIKIAGRISEPFKRECVKGVSREVLFRALSEIKNLGSKG